MISPCLFVSYCLWVAQITFSLFYFLLQFSSRRGVSKLDSSGMLLSQEREAWTREKVRLERALHHALAQVSRLRGEIRAETLREITGPEADNAALKVS